MKRMMMTLLSLCVASLSLMAQEGDSISELQPLLREKVTLEYDKRQGCYMGDTIHFKALVEREGKDGATDYSRVLYVELVHPYGYVVTRKKLRLVDGRTENEVVVDSLYGSGFYELRAYTRYMTNWNDYQYFSAIIPVYVPNSKLPKPLKDDERCIRTSSSRMVASDSYPAKMYSSLRDTIYGLKQPMESNLMVFGHIMPKKWNASQEDKLLGGRKLKVIINQGREKILTGDAETDSLGRYALYFPDVEGEWNMRIVAPKGERNADAATAMNRHAVTVDGLFEPLLRPYITSELTPRLFGVRKWKEDKMAEKWTAHFFPCGKAGITMKNEGYVSLGFYAYLGQMDNRFARTTGIASPTILNVARDTTYNKYLDINLLGKDSNDPRTVCVDGPSFNGRPIVWIVDGAYRLVTGLNKEITDFEVLKPTTASMPIYVDEVRSAYLTQDPEAFRPYVRCSVLEKKKPYTVFITLHHHYIWDDSGLMSTFFDGFSPENGEWKMKSKSEK